MVNLHRPTQLLSLLSGGSPNMPLTPRRFCGGVPGSPSPPSSDGGGRVDPTGWLLVAAHSLSLPLAAPSSSSNSFSNSSSSQGLTLAQIRAQLEDFREHVAHV
jgi:hypothetical protein